MSQSENINSAEALLEEFGKKFNIAFNGSVVDTNAVANVLIQTCFKKEVTYAQMTALLIVAKKYNLDPFTREIYAFPDKSGGIIPIVGVDGWSNIINSNEKYDGVEFTYSQEMVAIPDDAKMMTHVWCECSIYRTDRTRPTKVREYMGETYKPAHVKNGVKNNGPWQTHPNRMLRHKSLIQCARYAFGLTGLYDHDEGLTILNSQAADGQTTEVVQTTKASNEVEKTEPKQEKVVPEKEVISQEKFDKNYEAAAKLIDAGRSTAKAVIDKLESKYTLSNEQRELILKLEKQAA
ncbi:phage recombination protein Bet [Acinetobacter proteolyticus]|uniref:Phage recombination protein Bet n=1 Tax=Acinetobacter proteolyticus TaxID=1776741 RepID=A0A2N0WI95_9GAMM|nr:phage recombination protein Bet [Acinetobacter proteolyticus]PKF35530.1 phage recombination protein Bet [Acinetobacter proteolyticus]